MQNVETVEATATEHPLNSYASVAAQQELEVRKRWEAKREWGVQQENAHYEPDSDIFDAAEQVIELTSPERLAISSLNNEDLHREIVNARNVSLQLCAKTQAHARQRLIPLCEEMRKRFRRPGLKDRPFGIPTVDDYFKSIGVNYSTVRSWCAREKNANKLKTAFFRTPEYVPLDPMISPNDKEYERSAKDFEKIRKLIQKSVEIAQIHDIDLLSAASEYMIIVSRKFAPDGESLHPWHPSAALGGLRRTQ